MLLLLFLLMVFHRIVLLLIGEPPPALLLPPPPPPPCANRFVRVLPPRAYFGAAVIAPAPADGCCAVCCSSAADAFRFRFDDDDDDDFLVRLGPWCDGGFGWSLANCSFRSLISSLCANRICGAPSRNACDVLANARVSSTSTHQVPPDDTV